ncbi:FAM86B2 isoform 1, partial [Pan troglodytes]
ISLSPIHTELRSKVKDSSDSELLRDILQKTVKHPVCVKHPPSVTCARCFLSELIKKPSGGSVTLSESTAIISHGTTGLVTWDATLQNGPSRTRQPSLTDMLYCPEAIVSLVGVLWRLAACQEHKRTPEVYMAFTSVAVPGHFLSFVKSELTEQPGRAGIRWEAEAHHDQKLLPYGEHLEMAMLNLTL